MSIKASDIAIIGGLALGGYLLYTFLKDKLSPAAVAGDVAKNVFDLSSIIPGSPAWGYNEIMGAAPWLGSQFEDLWKMWAGLFGGGKTQPQYKQATYTSLPVTPLEVAYAPIQQKAAVAAYGPRTVSIAEKKAAIISTQPSPLLTAKGSLFAQLNPSMQAALLPKIAPGLLSLKK